MYGVRTHAHIFGLIHDLNTHRGEIIQINAIVRACLNVVVE
jgi:hypothetical protein